MMKLCCIVFLAATGISLASEQNNFLNMMPEFNVTVTSTQHFNSMCVSRNEHHYSIQSHFYKTQGEEVDAPGSISQVVKSDKGSLDKAIFEISGSLPQSMTIVCYVRRTDLKQARFFQVIPEVDIRNTTEGRIGKDSVLTVSLASPLPDHLETVWTKDGDQINDDRRVASSSERKNFSLTISKTEKDDEGMYYLLIYNPVHGIEAYQNFTKGVPRSLQVNGTANSESEQVSDNDGKSAELSEGTIAGIVIGILVALVIICIAIYCVRRRNCCRDEFVLAQSGNEADRPCADGEAQETIPLGDNQQPEN